MLKGFARPFTPEGKASPLTPLPWRFAGDLLLIHFRADAAALTSLLPPPLEPSNKPDEAFLWSPHLKTYPVKEGTASLNPARTHYNVAVIGIPCIFEGQRTMLSAFQWCDRDWLVIFSWFIGTCSKLASFEQSGTHPLFSAVGSSQSGGVGTTLNRAVTRNGDRIISMSVTWRERVEMNDLAFYTQHLPLTCIRHIPDCDVSSLGCPLVHDLTQMVMTQTTFGEIWQGDASLRFGESDNEELLPLQPTEVLGGYVLPMAFVVEGVKVIYDYLKL
jgi:hypothetical protein